MTRKTTTTAKNNRKPKKNKQPSLTKLRNAWKKANTPKRILIVGKTLIASIVALALIVGLVRFVGWRVQVDEAVASQKQLQTQYDFNPGNIISDGLFFNGNALSEQQVNAIIEKQGAACSGEKCLKSMTFSTESQPANEYCEAYEGEPNESAAAIIYKSGKACDISQKVLLTVLQKEQHLLTATDPSDFQFKSAMGLSCPDDANCDPEYAGFFKQVYGAAKRYQYYVRIAMDTMRARSTIFNTIRTPAAVAATCTSKTRRPHCCTFTRLISRMQPHWMRESAKATPVRPTAIATSRSSTIRCSALLEADFSIQLLMEGTDQKEPFMGLLNNNDYIDPFKGSDYIDPSSNAERLSNQVNRDHARRESYVQRRYVKPAQSDQASRDRQAPQNTRSKQDGRSQQAQGDQSTRGDTLQTMLNDWSTQTMRYAQSMQQSLQQALRQNQQNPQNPQGRPSQPYNPPRIQTERATREFQSTSDKKQRRHKNGFVTVLEIVIIIAVIASIGGMLSDSMSNIISDFDGSTSQFEELSTQETVSEDVGKLYSTGGKALEVNIEGVQTGPEDLNGDATLTVLLTCTNIGKKTMYPHAVADLMVMQNGIELAPAFTSNEDSDRTEFSGAEMKPKKSSQTTSSFVLTDTNSPVVVQLMNYSQHNVVRAAFSFDEVDIEGSLKHIDYAAVPQPEQVDASNFDEDGSVTDYDESTLHFRVDSIEKTSPSYADHDIAFARISWYVENGSKYRAFLNYMDVSATQDGTELHSTYLDDDSYSTTRKVTPGVKMTTTVAFETQSNSPVTFIFSDYGDEILRKTVNLRSIESSEL